MVTVGPAAHGALGRTDNGAHLPPLAARISRQRRQTKPQQGRDKTGDGEQWPHKIIGVEPYDSGQRQKVFCGEENQKEEPKNGYIDGERH